MNDIGSVLPRSSGIQLICIHNYSYYYALFSDEQSSGGGSNVSHLNVILGKKCTFVYEIQDTILLIR